MSRFTVMVIGPENQFDLEEALAPYDENEEGPPRRDYVDEDNIKRASEHYVCAPVFKELKRHWEAWSGKKLHRDKEGKLYEVTTYNEMSKWDWWVIGGRWAGQFLIKPEFREEWGKYPTMDYVDNKEVVVDPELKFADYAPIEAIDIQTMRQEAMAKATKEWDDAVAVIEEMGPLPEPPPKDSPREMWREYWDSPIVSAVSKALNRGWSADLPTDILDTTKEKCIKNASDHAVSGWATLHDGEWMAPGEMGWWGMSSATPGTKRDYHSEIAEIIDNLEEGTMLWMVDCHI